MKLAIMQPYIFPYLGYYQLVSCVDKFVIYDDVNYINKGWINRNNILVNGKAFLFTIPLKNASQNRRINETELPEDHSWKSKFLKTVEMSYKKAPFFSVTFSLLNDVINSNATHIHQMAISSIRIIADYLGLQAHFVTGSAVYNNSNLKAQQRILDICCREQASHYINPIGGMELYSRELFEAEGIKISFLKTGEYRYKQFDSQFTPHLSMIDVLMFNSREQIAALLKEYQLV